MDLMTIGIEERKGRDSNPTPVDIRIYDGEQQIPLYAEASEDATPLERFTSRGGEEIFVRWDEAWDDPKTLKVELGWTSPNDGKYRTFPEEITLSRKEDDED